MDQKLEVINFIITSANVIKPQLVLFFFFGEKLPDIIEPIKKY